MIVYVCLSLLLGLAVGQRPLLRSSRYDQGPYLSLPGKAGTGVGVLQDLSNARILSNEPFIISFEFPKLVAKSGDSRKSRLSAKRNKAQRKKNRKLRQFRQIVLPEGDLLERTKRFQFGRYDVPRMLSTDLFLTNGRRGKVIPSVAEEPKTTEKPNLPLPSHEESPLKTVSEKLSQLQEIIAPEKSEETDQALGINKQLESVKDKWSSLFQKEKALEENDVIDDEEKLAAKSRKMWENSPLLKLLKTQPRNPYFYKRVPADYPSLIPDKEKQKECNKKYDIIDLSRDKLKLSDKIEQFGKLLKSEFGPTDGESRARRRRDVEEKEAEKSEEETTLQDESLQGKTEGEVRSDRSKRTKMQPRAKPHVKTEEKKKIRRPPRKKKIERKLKRKESEGKGTEEVRTGRMVGSLNEIPQNGILKEAVSPKIGEVEEKKREKPEIKAPKDSRQDALSQSEPQKRESKNETVQAVQESAEDSLELEDAVKKLAKIFKILGVKADAKKKLCAGCEAIQDDDSDNTSLRLSKSDNCNCGEECPLCQNCLKCFKECKKNSAALKSPLRSKQLISEDSKGFNTDKNSEISKDGRLEVTKSVTTLPQFTDVSNDRLNNVKLDRMYRSKLPPSRDHVRVYFDNPENKLLVWTKRGRRTMPWEPLTSDLQLYRDRAKQILKSAEDILHRIKETEEKIHSGKFDREQSTEKKEEDMDSIIKQIVNEDATKIVLQTPWKELEKSSYDTDPETNQIFKDEPEKAVVQEVKPEVEEPADDSTVAAPEGDGQAPQLRDGQTAVTDKSAEIVENTESAIKFDEANTEAINPEMESGSVEAAVEEEKPKALDKNGESEVSEKSAETESPSEEIVPAKVEAIKNVDLNQSEETETSIEKTKGAGRQMDNFEESEEVESSYNRGKGKPDYYESEYEDNYKTNMTVSSESLMLEDSRDAENDYSAEVDKTEEVARSNEEEDEDKYYSDKMEKSEEEEGEEDVQLRNHSEEKSLEEPEAEREFEEETRHEAEDRAETVEMEAESDEKQNYSYEESSKLDEIREKEDKKNSAEEVRKTNEEKMNIFQDQIRPIEESYIIKGVKQTKEEKEAILKALQNVEGITEIPPAEEEEVESPQSVTTEESVPEVEKVESTNEESDSVQTLIKHLEKGQMGKEDFEVVKKLDDSKIDRLVSEMQKKDDKGQPVNCETRMKLCKAACGCNADDSDVTKYDIIKGFLSWLKGLQTDQMVPIST
ncbi:UNVERIFIED_CONTAM: hypothetical protein PYX00_004153 [Menopon gallinae]|uniref:Uncharacterized protein n=1 Tax=Menopon gallinae TaxID=328185 RepID=A0AAW2I2J6_9NEOP